MVQMARRRPHLPLRTATSPDHAAMSAVLPMIGRQISSSLPDVNFNLSVFWTLVVVVIGAPLLVLVLFWGMFMVALMLGYDPDI